MNYKKNWLILIEPPAQKSILKLPLNNRERVSVSIKNLALDPFTGDVQKMKGEKNVWRRRVGSYRFMVKRRSSNTY